LLACGVVALSVGIAACGSVGKIASSGTQGPSVLSKSESTSPPGWSERDTDGDIDSLGKSPYDSDNDAIPAFGQPAGPADRRAIIALVRRYYAAAAAGNGIKACAMLYTLTEESMVEEHHRGNGPLLPRDVGC